MTINLEAVEDGDVLTVWQVGSSNTIFRTSNELVYRQPTVVEIETEGQASLYQDRLDAPSADEVLR